MGFSFTDGSRRRLCRWLLALAVLVHPAADAAAFYAEQHQYAACMDDVPIRRSPNMEATRIGTIPRGAVVKVDSNDGPWIRVIYKVRQGYTIGWSMAGLLCPLDPSTGTD